MTTGKDQAQTIIGDFVEVEVWSFDDRLGHEVRIGFEFFLQACLTSQAIDGFVFRGLDDPGARRIGNAFAAPLADCSGEGFLCGVFGELEIAKLTY